MINSSLHIIIETWFFFSYHMVDVVTVFCAKFTL